MHIRPSLFVFALATAALPCQTAAPEATPHISLETVGPDGWRTRLGPTNIGSLLASQKGRELWEPQVLPLLAAWQQLVGDPATFAPVRERVLGYGGRVRIGVWLATGEFGRQDLSHGALVLDGDGRTDLAKLAEDVLALQQRAPGEWSDAELDGRKVRVLTHQDESMTEPLVSAEQLLVVVAGKQGLAAALTPARAFAAAGKPLPPDSPALRFSVDTAALVAMARAAQPDDGDWPSLTAIGLQSLGTSSLNVGTAGPHVQLELTQQFLGEQRGIFGALFPATQGLPSLLRLAASAPGSWKAGRFDWRQLYVAIEGAVAAREGEVEQMRREIRESMGVDLADDLLAYTTDEMLVLGSPFEDVDRLRETTWLLAVKLTDGAKFAANLETALGKAKPMLSREATTEHGKAKLHRYGNMFGYDLWFATGGDLFVMGGGAEAEEKLKALFDAAAAPAPETVTQPLAFAVLQRHLPPGLNGLAQGDLDSLAAIPVEWWLEIADEFVPLPDNVKLPPDPERQQQLRDLLKEHRLDVLRSATGYAEQTWRWRLYW